MSADAEVGDLDFAGFIDGGDFPRLVALYGLESMLGFTLTVGWTGCGAADGDCRRKSGYVRSCRRKVVFKSPLHLLQGASIQLVELVELVSIHRSLMRCHR